jgi:predicted metalloprotease
MSARFLVRLLVWLAGIGAITGMIGCSNGSGSEKTPLPMGFQEFVGETTSSLNAYWSLTAKGFAYTPPAVRPYRAGAMPETSCAEGTDAGRWVRNAFYCPDDRTVVFDADFLSERRDSIGPQAVTVVLAHEWAHHIQTLIKLSGSDLPLELHADCLAGAFLVAGATGSQAAIIAKFQRQQAAVEQIARSGDKAYRQSGWFGEDEHGSPALRWTALTIGMTGFGRASVCDSYATYRPSPPLEVGPYTISHRPGADYSGDGQDLTIQFGEVAARVEIAPPEPTPNVSAQDDLQHAFAQHARSIPRVDGTLDREILTQFDPIVLPSRTPIVPAPPQREVREPFGYWLSMTYVADAAADYTRWGQFRIWRPATGGPSLQIDAWVVLPMDTSGNDPRLLDHILFGTVFEALMCGPGQSRDPDSERYVFACDLETHE